MRNSSEEQSKLKNELECVYDYIWFSSLVSSRCKRSKLELLLLVLLLQTNNSKRTFAQSSFVGRKNNIVHAPNYFCIY